MRRAPLVPSPRRAPTSFVLRRACAILAPALLLGSCGGSPTAAVPDLPDNEAIPSPLDQGFWLGFGETAELDGGRLEVWFQGLTEDSRCPEVVVCVWEGRARIALVIRVDGGATQSAELILGGGAGTAEAPTSAAGYRFTLGDLTPRPISTERPPPDVYRALLYIAKGP
jgi:hypothetical protein